MAIDACTNINEPEFAAFCSASASPSRSVNTISGMIPAFNAAFTALSATIFVAFILRAV